MHRGPRGLGEETLVVGAVGHAKDASGLYMMKGGKRFDVALAEDRRGVREAHGDPLLEEGLETQSLEPERPVGVLLADVVVPLVRRRKRRRQQHRRRSPKPPQTRGALCQEHGNQEPLRIVNQIEVEPRLRLGDRVEGRQLQQGPPSHPGGGDVDREALGLKGVDL